MFLPEDLHHARSREWVESRFDQGIPLVAPTIALPELAGAIARRSGSVEFGLRALAAMQRFRRLRVVELGHRLASHSGMLAAELQMKGADSVYAAAADILQIPLVSWDRQQLERAALRVAVLSPD